MTLSEVLQPLASSIPMPLTLPSEGDIVLLRRVKKPPILTKPLKAGQTLGTHFGTIKHDDILGKSYRDTVSSSKAKYARIHRPTLGEYATLTPRIVTPVGRPVGD